MSAIKRVLQRLHLGKIAAVDLPCQEGAKALLVKRAGETDGAKLAKALCDAIRKDGVLVISDDDEASAAETFDQAISDVQTKQDFFDTWYQATDALRESITSILEDETIDDKSTLIAQSLQQFAAHVEQKMPDSLGKSIAAGIAELTGQSGINKGAEMNAEMLKALGLSEGATEADVLKALADRNAQITTLEGELTVLKAKVPPVEPDDDECAKAIQKGDAFKAQNGTVIFKKDCGPGVFDLLKSQDELIQKQGDDLTKSREAALESDFAKRADDMGFGSDFGPTLRKALSGDAAAGSELEKKIAALKAQAEEGGVFKAFGHNSPEAGSAAAEFAAKVAEIEKANPDLTHEQAYAKAYTDRGNAPLKKRMQDESRRAAN